MRYATLGKILGAIGLLLVLFSPYTFFITTGSPWLAGGKALVGLVLLGLYFATNYGQLTQFASRKSSFYFASTALTALVFVGALGAVNYIAAKKNKTWDLTNKKIYTLAPQTVSSLKELKETVKAIGFIQSNHPYYDALQNLFERYHREAPEKFEYTFKDPRKNPDLAAKYELKEGQTTVVLTRGEGANEAHSALNVISEQELTNALIKLNTVGEQKVYVLQGHGEWPLEAGAQGPGAEGKAGLSELSATLKQEGYTTQSLNLLDQPEKMEVPRDAALLIIPGAKSKISEPEQAALKKYLDEGGRMLYFAEATAEPQLDTLLADYGVKVDPGIVADDKVNPGNPYIILSAFYGEHEATRLLKQLRLNVELPTVRGFTILPTLPAGVKADALVNTSPFAWEETTLNDRPMPDEGERTGQIPIVVASSKTTSATEGKRFDEARLVALGDSELIVDANWGHEPNRNLVMNTLAWATQQTSKITIRPPDRDISTLDVTNELLNKIRFVATDLLPLSLLATGLAIWLTRRNK